MFVRIVKMSFNPESIPEFLKMFDEKKELIRNFEGCRLLELYRDKYNDHKFFTYSYWDSEDALENYRRSDLFNGVWAETKKHFNARPEAWSVDKIVSLE